MIKAVIVPGIQKGINQRSQYVQELRDEEDSYLRQIDDLTQKVAALKKDHHDRVQKSMEAALHGLAAERETRLATLQEQLSAKTKKNREALELEIKELHSSLPTLIPELVDALTKQMQTYQHPKG